MGKYLGETKSGSVNGITFAHNRYGQYFRKHAIPVNPNTEKQRATRTAFAQASAVWSSLTDLEHSGWNYVAQQYPVTDKMGVQKTLDGHTFFTRFNIKRILAGAEILRDIELDDIAKPSAFYEQFSPIIMFSEPPWLSLDTIYGFFNVFAIVQLCWHQDSSKVDPEPASLNKFVVRRSPACKFKGSFVAQNDFIELASWNSDEPAEILPGTIMFDRGAHLSPPCPQGVIVAFLEDDNYFTFPYPSCVLWVKRGYFPVSAYYRIQIVLNDASLINEEILFDFWLFIK